MTQHGVRGLPDDVVNEDPKARAYATYKAFAVRLAERGFIVFAPHNPYRGDDASRVLQRKAQPIGKTIFSIILSFTDWKGIRLDDINWVGFQNYVQIFTVFQKNFFQALINNTVLLIFLFIGPTALGIGLAYLLVALYVGVVKRMLLRPRPRMRAA